MKKVLIIGLGSIGQKHAKALISLGITNLGALRTGKGALKIETDLTKYITIFNNETDAFQWNPTHILISNPTSLHIDFIKKAIDSNLKFFVEKPISNNIDDINIDKNYDQVNGIVGYNLRFNGLFKFIKDTISSNIYGRVITAKLHVGQYLPNWHPYEDYRNAYYAKKDLGGGALRTLSHEIDLIQFLFGNVKSVFAKIDQLSDLEIDVDDVVNITGETALCKQVNLHVNFLDPAMQRCGKIYFSLGVLEYNFVKNDVTYIDNKTRSKTIIYSSDEDFETQYLHQMRDFISDEKSDTACTFIEGMSVMKIIEACERSNNEKKEICLV